MRANELIAELEQAGKDANYTHTCDTIKAGDPERPLRKVGVTMMPTAEVLEQAALWGADMLIVHEPLYYVHHDNIEGREDDPVIAKKKLFVEECGITIYRYHDHMHHNWPDLICEGEMKSIDVDGLLAHGYYYATSRYFLDSPMTALQMAKRIEDKLGIAHVRVIGDTKSRMTRVSCCFGATGHLTDEVANGQELVLCGEADEWCDCEYFRDAAKFGIHAALLVLGHVGSERDGMKLLAQRIGERHQDLDVRYFDCGEVYTYTDKQA